MLRYIAAFLTLAAWAVLMAGCQVSEPPSFTEKEGQIEIHKGTVYHELPGCSAGLYIGELKNELPHGFGTWSYPDGGEYAGQWEKGLFHGPGTYTWPDGQAYEGAWEEGFPHGKGTMTYPDGTPEHGEWSGGRMVRPIHGGG